MVTETLFHVVARFYGWMTAQRAWREHCQKLVADLPRRREPASGIPPGRIQWLQGDALRLPFADQSVDCLTGHSFLYLIPDRTAALRECLRVLRPGGWLRLMEPNKTLALRSALQVSSSPPFLLSMILWRPVSRLYGRFTTSSLEETLSNAGFASARVEETLGGMGLLARAVRPAA